MADAPDKKRSAFNRLLEAAEQNHQKHAIEWKKNEKAYEGKNHPKPSGRDVGKSRLFVQYAYQQIETIKVRLVEPSPSFRFNPTEPGDEDAAKGAEVLAQYQLRRDEFAKKQVDWVHDAVVPSLCVAKVLWKNVTTKKTIRKELNLLQRAMGMPEEEEIEIVEFDQPTAIVVDPYDFFWDPAATCDDDMSYAIHRVWLTPEELKDRGERLGYNNVDEAIGAAQGGSDEGQRIPTETSDEATARRGNRIEVHELWTRDTVQTWAGRSILLRDEPNPFLHGRLPFVTGSTQPAIRRIPGISEVANIAPIQDYIWAIENMRIDAAKLAINPPFKYRSTASGGREFKVVPGGRIPVDRMDDIEPLIQNPGTVFGTEEKSLAMGDMMNMSGANSYLSGADNNIGGINNTTATGISLVQQEANKRMSAKMFHLQLFYSRIVAMFHALNQQYLDDAVNVRVGGEQGSEWLRVAPQDIAGEYDIEPVWSNLSMNRTQERQDAMEMLAALQQVAGVTFPDGTTVSLKPAVERVVASYQQFAEPYFADAQQAVVEQAQAQMAGQQVMQPPPEAQNAPIDAAAAGFPG